ncbi:MAG: hypothetical protein QOE10_2152, partial [Gaiellales bacterium]|nr:hypothetical protein [Gaiellales bacterium]
MPRLRRLAARTASLSVLGLELPLLALWGVLGTILSLIAARVTDWNAMTDELVYERLAISIAQTHSILPRLHGEVVRSLAQLYPMLISPWFSHGYVPENLKNAHAFDAWLMSSACIPAFLLARRVTDRRWPAYTLAVLTACTPWIIYSTVLLTEVAAYPAFMWAMLGMHKALTAPSARNDVLAFLGLALAFFARTQLVGLIAVLPVAMLVYALTRPHTPVRAALKKTLRSHVTLACLYAALAAAALGLIVSGRSLSSLSVYGNENTSPFPPGWAGSVTGH